MQEISPNSHTLTFPTLLICCSAAEGKGGERRRFIRGISRRRRWRWAGAAVEQQPAHLIYHWDMGGGGGGGGACGSEFTLCFLPPSAQMG